MSVTITPLKLLKKLKGFNKKSKNVKFHGTVPAAMEPEFIQAKPFETIPGPKPLPVPFGNLWNFTFGKYGKLDYTEMHGKLFSEFGPVVRVSGLTPQNYVILYDPSYVETMFRNDSVWPKRDGFDCVNYYLTREKKEDYAVHGGILFKNGQGWYDIRTAVNKMMMRPKCAEMYIEPIDEVTAQFIERIEKIRRHDDQEMPKDFLKEIKKWALESIGTISLDTRFHCLKGELSPDAEAHKLIESIENALELISPLNAFPQLWRYVSTPTWQKFVKNVETMSAILKKHIALKLESTKVYAKEENFQPKSVLESILMHKKENPVVAMTMCIDMFIAGIDTTSNAAATAIYHLANNPDKQEILFEELKRLLPCKNDPVTWNRLREFKYLRGCFKESMRISPTVPFSARTATRDYVIADYQIPNGTSVFGVHILMCNSEKYFKHPNKFLPERWLKSESGSEISAKNSSPFLLLPFGFGPRMCIGRRFAELELEILLAKIFRNFKVEYNHGDMTWTKNFLYGCREPLQFKMIDRSIETTQCFENTQQRDDSSQKDKDRYHSFIEELQ